MRLISTWASIKNPPLLQKAFIFGGLCLFTVIPTFFFQENPAWWLSVDIGIVTRSWQAFLEELSKFLFLFLFLTLFKAERKDIVPIGLTVGFGFGMAEMVAATFGDIFWLEELATKPVLLIVSQQIAGRFLIVGGIIIHVFGTGILAVALYLTHKRHILLKLLALTLAMFIAIATHAHFNDVIAGDQDVLFLWVRSIYFGLFQSWLFVFDLLAK